MEGAAATKIVSEAVFVVSATAVAVIVALPAPVAGAL